MNLHPPLCVKGVMTLIFFIILICSLRFTYNVNKVFAQKNK